MKESELVGECIRVKRPILFFQLLVVVVPDHFFSVFSKSYPLILNIPIDRDEDKYEEQLNMLFKVCHTSNFHTSVQVGPNCTPFDIMHSCMSAKNVLHSKYLYDSTEFFTGFFLCILLTTI